MEIKNIDDNTKLDDWMDNITMNTGLPDAKGTILSIRAPVNVKTKFGDRLQTAFVIQGSDKSQIAVSMFLPAGFPNVHPKSNLAKIMAQNGCTGLRELIGKEVELLEHGEGMWKIKVE